MALGSEAAARPAERIRLVLFVTGLTPRSLRAVRALEALCRQEFEGASSLEVVDVYREPARAIEENVFAVPLLIRYEPAPERRIVGDLSDMGQVRRSLGLKAA